MIYYLKAREYSRMFLPQKSKQRPLSSNFENKHLKILSIRLHVTCLAAVEQLSVTFSEKDYDRKNFSSGFLK